MPPPPPFLLRVLAVATREVWAFVIVVWCCVVFWWGPRVVVVANAGLALVVFWWVHQIKSLPSANFFFPYPGHGSILRFWLDFRFSDLTEFARMIWATLVVVELIPVVLVLRSPVVWPRSELDRGQITAVALLVSGVLSVATAPFSWVPISLGSHIRRGPRFDRRGRRGSLRIQRWGCAASPRVGIALRVGARV